MRRPGLELANATLHNSFYFHKHENRIRDLDAVLMQMQCFIEALLTSRRSDLRMRIKDWGRAYINLGLMRHMRGEARRLPCGAATDSFYVSPWGEILACNGSAEPWAMGDLNTQSFEETWHSAQAEVVRQEVRNCRRNCWMTGTAVPAVRRTPWVPALWILKNKLRLAAGQPLDLR